MRNISTAMLVAADRIKTNPDFILDDKPTKRLQIASDLNLVSNLSQEKLETEQQRVIKAVELLVKGMSLNVKNIYVSHESAAYMHEINVPRAAADRPHAIYLALMPSNYQHFKPNNKELHCNFSKNGKCIVLEKFGIVLTEHDPTIKTLNIKGVRVVNRENTIKQLATKGYDTSSIVG